MESVSFQVSIFILIFAEVFFETLGYLNFIYEVEQSYQIFGLKIKLVTSSKKIKVDVQI